jgi:hypothetical protein
MTEKLDRNTKKKQLCMSNGFLYLILTRPKLTVYCDTMMMKEIAEEENKR